MSQLVTARINRRLAVLLQEAVPALAGKVVTDQPRTVLVPPKAAVLCPKVSRPEGFATKNRWLYQPTVYIRLPLTGVSDVDAEKDAIFEAFYDLAVTANGRFAEANGTVLAYRTNVVDIDRKNYADEQNLVNHFDLGITFSMEADVDR